MSGCTGPGTSKVRTGRKLFTRILVNGTWVNHVVDETVRVPCPDCGTHHRSAEAQFSRKVWMWIILIVVAIFLASLLSPEYLHRVFTDPPPVDNSPIAEGQVWAGSYNCDTRNGLLEIAIGDRDGNREFDATVRFVLAEFHGSYSAKVSISDGAKITIDGEEWIDEPDGYELDRFHGDFTATNISGEMQGCSGAFSLDLKP